MSTVAHLTPAAARLMSSRPLAVELSRKASSPTPAQQTFRWVWFCLLLGAICFEGLGRRYFPGIPSAVFYFLKDGVLVLGFIRFRINRDVRTTFASLYRGFAPFLKLALLWTLIEILNPDQASLSLGLVGFRAYWLWWIAPLVVASVLLDSTVRQKVILILAVITVIVSVLAILQFGAPAEDAINTYSMVNGEESVGIPVGSTGRARVSSTFSFLSGFGDFAVLVPVLLLSIGLGEKNRSARLAALIATLLAAASLPMSGSRGPFVISLVLCTMVVWRVGLIFTQVGRRIIFVALAAGFASVFAFPDAIQGVKDRFEGSDTEDRITEFFSLLPPVALVRYFGGYSPLGSGTGMMQNYRQQFGVLEDPNGSPEGEVGRYLWELGPAGYLLFWTARFGLAVVLWKSSKILKKAGRRASSAGALAYAFLGLNGSLTFDHIFSALFFVGFGFILQEVVQVRTNARRLAAEHRALATGAGGAAPAVLTQPST